MNSTSMVPLKLHFTQLNLHHNIQKQLRLHPCNSISAATANPTCGLRRKGPRKPLWRSRVLSTEAIQAVQALKLSRSAPKLEEVLRSRLTRLLKVDLEDALGELQRQNETVLALKVFEFMQKEAWYVPDLSLYCDMILLLGKNEMITKAEELFSELKKKGLEPNTRAYTEMIGAYLQSGMTKKAVETYDSMKMANCAPDRLTFTILIRNLEKAGEVKLTSDVKKECCSYLEDAEQFLQEIEQKNVRDAR